MQHSTKKRAILAVAVILVIGFISLIYLVFLRKALEVPAKIVETVATSTYKVIGSSVQGRKIESYTYGGGAKHLVFVGGIHGGYEWNLSLIHI